MGQWVLTMQTTGDSGFVFFHRQRRRLGDEPAPRIDYFITSSVSLGASSASYSPAAKGTTVLDLGARAGFNLNINDRIGFWPTAGFA